MLLADQKRIGGFLQFIQQVAHCAFHLLWILYSFIGFGLGLGLALGLGLSPWHINRFPISVSSTSLLVRETSHMCHTGTDIYWQSCGLKSNSLMKREKVLKQINDTPQYTYSAKRRVKPTSCYQVVPGNDLSQDKTDVSRGGVTKWYREEDGWLMSWKNDLESWSCLDSWEVEIEMSRV